MSNPLTLIINRFRLTTEALAVVKRVIESGADKSLIDTNLALTGNRNRRISKISFNGRFNRSGKRYRRWSREATRRHSPNWWSASTD